ncbi:MAG TPA: ABC transporter permease [Acidimicrobiales bacterium]|nr:ABC transporter permease [Acidimicrobiales bacterium]
MSSSEEGAVGLRERAGAWNEKYKQIDPKKRTVGTIAAIAITLAIAYRLPGLGSWLSDKMPFAVIVIGLVLGTVTALLAMGLILIYRTNRFINFAYGSMGSLAGVLAVGMHLQHGWSFWVALPVGVVGGAIVGGLVEVLVIRRFANASRLILTVASIGLAQLLGGFELLGSKAIDFVSLTGGFNIPLDVSVDLGAKTLTGDEMLIVAVVPFVIAFIAWFLLKTDAGVAVRAAAENADRALLYGIPIKRLSTIVWIIAGSLSALTFIMKSPFTGIAPGAASQGPTVLLPALAAAVVARMESLPAAFVAGVSLGVIEQLVRWNYSDTPSMVNVVFLAIILGSLLLQKNKLSRAHETGASTWSATGIIKPIPRELRRLPEIRIGKAVLFTAIGLAFVFVPMSWGPSRQLLAAVAMVWGMTAVSLVVLTGWGGHISLGQFALVGVGGLVAGNLLVDHNTDLFVTLLASGIAGGLVAMLVGLPALRIKGLFLAVTTMALAIALDSYVLNFNNFPDLIPTSIDRPLLWGRYRLEDEYAMYALCLAFLALSMLVAAGVRKARSGRVLIAIRDNQRAAESAAVPATATKLSAFLLAGVIAGVAGGLHVQILHSLNPGTYNPAMSLDIFSTAVIGGLGSVGGALIGVLLFRWLETITALGDLRLLLTGAGLLVVLYALPGGLGQLVFSLRDRLLRRVADRRGILVPSLVADKRVTSAEEAEDVSMLATAMHVEEVDEHAEADKTEVGV